MTSWLALVKKELRMVARERTIIIALLIQLVLAAFSSALLLGLLSFYDPDSISVTARVRLRVGVLGDPASPLVNLMRQRNMRVTGFFTPDQAQAAYERGRVDALVYIPPDTGAPVEMKIFLPRSETLSSLFLILLRAPLKDYENELRHARGVEMAYTQVRGQPSTAFEFLYAVIVPVLLFFPAFVAGSMVVDSLTEEMENQTLETLCAAPLSLHAIFSAKIFAAGLLAVMQIAAWMILLRLNGIELSNPVWVFGLAVLVAAVNAVLSGVLAAALRERDRSQFAYSLVILAVVGLSTVLDASPMKLMMQLASGDAYVAGWQVLLYLVPLGALLLALGYGTARLAHA
ncbi:MAG: ABC transporter permease [Chloroflexi bacterium]|nr:ABC transporter permease [Chloroflexota bacterium]